jgi:hypothetical protein
MKNIMVFKTDITHKRDLLRIGPLLADDALCISRWTVDRTDIDRVLRVETLLSQPATIIDLLHSAGYACEEMTD